MNNSDNSLVIPANKAQDLLNVQVTPGGRSVKKRAGYGLAATLSVSTSPVHGIYNFFDASGNSVDLYFNDSHMSASVNSGSTAVLFSTGSNGATYQCVDSQGFAYCNNSARTTLTKTNGSTYSSITSVNSTGTLIAVTQERLATSGFSEAPNRVDLSKANDFATWTVGGEPTDPLQFTIVAPGSRMTHIVYAFGRIIWFKDSSFGYILEGDTQDDWQIRTISPNVGTLDNTSVYWQGILYFRGQDGNIFGYDGANYEKLTRDIQGTISASQSRRSNSWTQTSAADWQAGLFQPSSSNFTVDGAITTKGWSEVETSSSEFNAGTFDTTVYVDTQTNSGSLQTTFPDTFSTFRTGASSTKNVWNTFTVGSGTTDLIAVSGGQLVLHGSNTGATNIIAAATTAPSHSLASTGATWYFDVASMDDNSDNDVLVYFVLADVVDTNPRDETTANRMYFLIASTNTSRNDDYKISNLEIKNSLNQTKVTTSSSTAMLTSGSTVRFWVNSTHYGLYVNDAVVVTGSLNGFDPQRRWYSYFWMLTQTSTDVGLHLDNYTIMPQTFTYTSPGFDTTISSPTWGTFTGNQTGTGFTFTSQVSADNSTFDSGVSATSGASLTSGQKRYVKLNATANYSPATLPDSVISLQDITLTAYSTGTFYSQVKNASSLTGWDTFTATYQDNGGSNTFYIRSASYSFATNASVPSWTAITNGAVPSVSTNTYFQIRADISAASYTSLPALSDFTQNWFEGSATDKSYGAYFDDALWWAVVSGTGSTTNNRTLRYDFLNADWTLYDLASNGFLVKNNAIYFGSATEGKVFKFGDVDNDNGAAINAYWKSKDFFGDSPFLDKEIVNLSVFADSVQNSSMSVTYSLNGSSSTSYTMNLYDANKTVVRSNKNLPQGKIGNTFSVQFGNNAADQPFEVFAIQYGVRQKSWIPTP